MNSDLLSKYKELDRELGNINKEINWLENLNPVNLKEEKELFFENNCNYTPKFEYKKSNVNYNELISKLNSLSIPKGEFHDIFYRRLEYLKSLCKLILKREEKDFIEVSKNVFGVPSKDSIDEAKEILYRYSTVIEEPENLNIDPRKAKKFIEEALLELNLKGWEVKFRDKYGSAVNTPNKVIWLSNSRKFNEVGLKKLILHEIEVHVLKAQNGLRQMFPFLFGTNDAKSLLLEEGLAIFTQVSNNLMPPKSWVNISAKVIAIDAMVKGKSFIEIFHLLKSYGVNERLSFGITARIFRGGGLTKDYIYLEGLNLVRTFSGNIRDLYIARVHLEDVEWAKETLEKPLYLPRYLQ